MEKIITIEERERLEIERLKNGDFSEVRLDYLFVHNRFDYIKAIVESCDKNLDMYMLNFVSIYAQQKMIVPKCVGSLENEIAKSGLRVNTTDYEELLSFWNDNIFKEYERILQQVIIVGCKHKETYGPILVELINHPNDSIRLYGCAYGIARFFLEDSSQRVKKVANIRYNFEQKWNSLKSTDTEKQRIEFLTAAIEKGAIQCTDGFAEYKEDDKMYAIFDSMLFRGGFAQRGFDKDIFYTIPDKRILADTLNQLILEGEISLRESMVPSCFGEEKSGPVLLKK